jgi:hypothetical protein
MSAHMRRRDLIVLLGGAAATWPLPVLAQQKERVRRIGVLNTFAAEDPEGQARIAALPISPPPHRTSIWMLWASVQPDC